MRDFFVDRLGGTRFDAPARRLYSRLRGKQMSRTERRNREYDDLTVTIIRRVMSRDSNSVDAGAHKGHFLRHLVRAAPQGT